MKELKIRGQFAGKSSQKIEVYAVMVEEEGDRICLSYLVLDEEKFMYRPRTIRDMEHTLGKTLLYVDDSIVDHIVREKGTTFYKGFKWETAILSPDTYYVIGHLDNRHSLNELRKEDDLASYE